MAEVTEGKDVQAEAAVQEVALTEEEQALKKLAESGLSLDFDDVATEEEHEEEGIRARLLVSPKISASLQHQMVDSIAYMLLSNKAVKGVSNVETVKSDLEGIQKKYEAAAVSLTGDNRMKIDQVIGNYQLLSEHFNELVERAKTVLENLGIGQREEDDYYENFESLGEDTGYRDNSEDNATRNQKDFLPADVRKLLYFLPELAPLDMNNPRDFKIANDTGKNYKNAKNALGLDSFNNFNDTWEKLLSLTSSTKFGSTKEGFDAMMRKLQDPANAPIIQELADKVSKAPDQLKNAFFRNTYLQNQRNMTLMYTVKTVSNWVNKVKEEFSKRTAFMIRSDRRSAEKKILSDLYNEFKANRTGILAQVADSSTGKDIFIINTEVTKGLLAEAQAIASNPDSYSKYEKRSKGKSEMVAGDYFTDEAKISLYKIIQRTGLGITWGAFKDVIKHSNKSLSKATGERSIFKDLFLDKYLSRLAGTKDETSVGVPFEKNNPFSQESSVMDAIAKQEYKYRTLRRSGAYRLDGKSYYAYTRHNMLSELFLELYKGSDFVANKLKFDDFARRSRILNLISDPTEEDFAKSFELFYELGAKNRGSDNPTKLLKNMSPREHTIMRVAAYQNDGKKAGIYMYDTLSDKVTKPMVQMSRMNIQGYTIGDRGRVFLSENVMDTMMNYFEAEYDRIKQVEVENKEFNDPANGKRHKLIKNYHDVGSKMGMGKYFHMYYFLNKAFLDADNPTLSALVFNADGSLKDRSAEATKGIKSELGKHFNKLFLKNKADFQSMGLFDVGYGQDGVLRDDIKSFIDHNYLTRKHGVLYNLGYSLDKKSSRLLDEGRYGEVLGPDILNDAINYATIDYVMNSVMFSNEMLMLTGDPAQAGKPASKDEVKVVKEKYKDNPSQAAKYELLAHIISTFTNLGKRNASFLASGEKGMFDNAKYKVAIANDIAINSTHYEDYRRMFPDNVEGVAKAYVDGDLTDAQEVTTVEEHLHVMKAYGKISEQTYRKALYHYDRHAYNMLFPGSGETISDEDKLTLWGVVMQPMKPVQRASINEPDMRMSKQYYIKTSSYPLIPDLVKSTPMEALLNDMTEKGVHRVAFISGVKQGVAGAKDIFTKDAEGNDSYNGSFLENNQNELDREGFRIQLEVPYKADKDHIREGTQQSKLMFVDIPHDLEVMFRGETASVADVQNAYIEYHKRIVDNQTKGLMEEIANPNGTINVQKLSRILQDEGEGRGLCDELATRVRPGQERAVQDSTDVPA
jgi:hypothetical protein